MTDLTKILLVDNNADHLAQALLASECMVTVARDGKQALAYLSSNQKYDIVILEVILPELDGWEVLKSIRKSDVYGEIPVIILTSESDVRKMVYGLTLGADDYIVKPFNLYNLLARIGAVLRRSKPCESEVLSPNVTNNQKSLKNLLTPREKDVLLLVAKGLNNSSIAKELFVSTVTVKAHLQSVFRKLKVKSRTQAVLAAMENDITDKE